MTVLPAFLTRKAQQPQLNEPMPSKEKRQDKERTWLASIGRSGHNKGSRQSSAVPSLPPNANAIQSQNQLSVAEKRKSRPPSPDMFLLPRSRSPAPTTVSNRSSFTRKLLRKASANSIKSNKTKSPKADEDQEKAAAWDFVSTSAVAPQALPPQASLGAKLQELSTAWSDGLLDDAEYRELKRALFEKFNASAALPEQTIGLGIGNEENLYRRSRASRSNSTLTPATKAMNLDAPAQQTRNTSKRASSILSSRRSLILPTPSISGASTKFFTSKSKSAMSLREDWQSLNQAHSAEQLATSGTIERDSDSILSGASSAYPRRHASTTSARSTHSGSHGSMGVRSFLHPPIDTSPSFGRTGTYASSSRASFASNTSSRYPHSSQSISRQSYVSHSFETSTAEADQYAIASSSELQTDIKALQDEFQAVDEQFRELIERAKLKHIRQSPFSITVQKVQHSKQDTTPDLSTTQYATFANSSSSSSHVLLSPVQIRTRSLKSILSSPKSSTRRKQIIDSPHTASTPPLSPSLSIQSHSSPGRSLSSRFDEPASPPTTIHDAEFDSPEDAKAFKEELARINARRRQVAEKYVDRLNYLQTRLKGAQIRESLPH